MPPRQRDSRHEIGPKKGVIRDIIWQHNQKPWNLFIYFILSGLFQIDLVQNDTVHPHVFSHLVRNEHREGVQKYHLTRTDLQNVKTAIITLRDPGLSRSRVKDFSH